MFGKCSLLPTVSPFHKDFPSDRTFIYSCLFHSFSSFVVFSDTKMAQRNVQKPDSGMQHGLNPDGMKGFCTIFIAGKAMYRTRQNACRPICLMQKEFYTLATHLISIMNSENARR